MTDPARIDEIARGDLSPDESQAVRPLLVELAGAQCGGAARVALQKSSQRTGCAASTLLLACLSLAAPPAKPAKKAWTARKPAAKTRTKATRTRRSK